MKKPEGVSLKQPRRSKGRHEGWNSAARRWVRRWNEYRDAQVMDACDRASRSPISRKELNELRAFWKVPHGQRPKV